MQSGKVRVLLWVVMLMVAVGIGLLSLTVWKWYNEVFQREDMHVWLHGYVARELGRPDIPVASEGDVGRAVVAASRAWPVMNSMTDRWGTPFEVEAEYANAVARVQCTSAGPDRTFGTGDDIVEVVSVRVPKSEKTEKPEDSCLPMRATPSR